MIRVSTFAELKDAEYGLALYCMACDRWGEVDLARLIDTGHGGRTVTNTRFRCRDCGNVLEKQLRAPVPEPGGAIAYI
jgi:hypothetical protein